MAEREHDDEGLSPRTKKILWSIASAIFFALIGDVLPEMLSEEPDRPPPVSDYVNRGRTPGELDGFWSGELYRVNRSGTRETIHEYELFIRMLDDLVTGTLYAESAGNRPRQSYMLAGEFERNRLTLIHTTTFTGVAADGPAGCLMRTPLIYSGDTLAGEVRGAGCEAGTVEFMRR